MKINRQKGNEKKYLIVKDLKQKSLNYNNCFSVFSIEKVDSFSMDLIRKKMKSSVIFVGVKNGILKTFMKQNFNLEKEVTGQNFIILSSDPIVSVSFHSKLEKKFRNFMRPNFLFLNGNIIENPNELQKISNLNTTEGIKVAIVSTIKTLFVKIVLVLKAAAEKK